MDITKQARKWVIKASKTRSKLKDEAVVLLTELVREYGEDEGDNIVIDLAENDLTITVMDYNGFIGTYIARDVEKIELSKEEYDEIFLIYGEDESEFIKFSDVTFSDRIFIIDELLSICPQLESGKKL